MKSGKVTGPNPKVPELIRVQPLSGDAILVVAQMEYACPGDPLNVSVAPLPSPWATFSSTGGGRTTGPVGGITESHVVPKVIWP